MSYRNLIEKVARKVQYINIKRIKRHEIQKKNVSM